MATFALLICLAGTATGQMADGAQIWSSVAYVVYGDRTPLLGPTTPALTPLGAQQLYAQGYAFRDRYLNVPLMYLPNQTYGFEGIMGIEGDALDNGQLSILSTDDAYVAAGASAFMQGLYPPMSEAFADGNGGMAAAELADGSLVNFPLDGYQYGNILTASVLDPNSIWIEGHVACSEYQASILEARDEHYAQEVYNSSLPFYSLIWTSAFWNSALPESMANFFYAYDMYDYASYNYIHDNNTRTQLSAGDIDQLESYAIMQQQDLNGNLTASGLYPGDMIRAIAGRTLMAKVVADLQANVAAGGTTNKLNLMFGSFEPLLAFFALSGLSTGASAATFQDLPGPGAVVVFEMFTVGANTSEYPTTDDLWVRFLYRNSSDAETPFIQYALFDNGNSQSEMAFDDFVTSMDDYAVASTDAWCDICNAPSTFCALDSSSTDGSGPSGDSTQGGAGIHPAVAGVIGAAVTVATIGLGLVAAIALGGVRFYRAGPGTRHRSSLGGFKGAEKMASDVDIVGAAAGDVRHERTGSWELQSGKGAADAVVAAAPTTADAGAAGLSAFVTTEGVPRIHAQSVDGDAVSVMDSVPVVPREF